MTHACTHAYTHADEWVSGGYDEDRDRDKDVYS